jgi:type II secretory pathway pseudopilin PulG
MSHKASAFSLIEMAIVLIIIGLISGFTLPTLKNVIEAQKTKTTELNQEKIMYAMASYANQYKFLPYAADPLNPTGKEDRASCRRRGIVPYTDLGLPESTAKDGHHRWFTYVIDIHYAVLPQKTIQTHIAQTPFSRLCDIGTHLNSLRIKGKQSSIAFALISHGFEGRGAYPHTINPPPQSVDEEQNSTSDLELIDRSMSTDPQNLFSHKVAWVTARNLLALYGHTPCPPILDSTSQQGGTRFEKTQ